MDVESSPRLAWRQSLGAGLLLGLALGCAWLARATPHLYPRLLLLLAAAMLALLGLGLMLALSDERGWTATWQRRWTSTFPAAGVPFFSALIILTVAAITSGNNLLYLVVSGLLAALLVSGLVSALNLSGMELSFQMPEEVFAGQPVAVRFQLANAKRFWPAYSLSVSASAQPLATAVPAAAAAALRPVYFSYLPGGATTAAAGELEFPQRGRYSAAAFELVTRFPFGLVQKRRRFHASARQPELLVYPAPTPGVDLALSPGREGDGFVQHLRGDSQELYRLRPHQPGDSARSVHWKASARAGTLMVRESSASEGRRLRLRLELPPSLDPAQAEAALSLCAGWMLALDQPGLWLEFLGAHPTLASRTGLFLPLAPASRHRRAVLDYLALVDPARPAPALHASPALPEILIAG